MGWSDERIEILKKLWQEGLSATQIAKQLRGVTRNSVIGKIHRLGLSGRAVPSKPSHTTAKPRRAQAPVNTQRLLAAKATPVASKVVVPFTSEPVGLASCLTLGPRMCKWPIGDPQLPNFAFCGRRAEEGPYCPEHAAVAYQAPNPARKAKDAKLAAYLRRYVA